MTNVGSAAYPFFAGSFNVGGGSGWFFSLASARS